MKLIECVPNFSLGRKVKDFLALKKFLLAQKNIHLLDITADPDHNRTVATLVGRPAAIQKTIILAVARVFALADIRCHKGVHPCVGLIDVVPFVPLKNIALAECVRLARQTGQILAQKFQVPVFLYEAAAFKKERKNLAAIRQGGLKNLAQRIEMLEGEPDFGPARLHQRGGAVIIGARNFLIAFNVNLVSRNLKIAQKIAAAVREKDGGLHGIKALGFYLPSQKCVQISVNICNFKKTGLMKLMTEIRKLAKIYQVEIKNSEIIGLVPQAALKGVEPEFLGLADAGGQSHGFLDIFEGRLFKWI